MQKTLFRRIGSGLLSLLMMSTLAISPTLAADSRSESAAVSTQAASDFTITPVGTVTADSTQVTLRIDCADTEVSTVNVFLLPVNTYGYNEDNPIAKKWSAAIGDVTLDVSAGKLTAGSRFCVKLTYTKDDDVQEVFSDYFTVAASGEKTREEIIAAARLAGADGFVRELKDGYDTYVGERGVKLSGGQKQRISIARVFLKNPPILLLDEATSALDNESEILVGQSLDKLAKGRTTLTIAHRLTTIKNADRILVLGKSGIEEEGRHEELLAKKGIYYRLWNGLVSGQTL